MLTKGIYYGRFLAPKYQMVGAYYCYCFDAKTLPQRRCGEVVRERSFVNSSIRIRPTGTATTSHEARVASSDGPYVRKFPSGATGELTFVQAGKMPPHPSPRAREGQKRWGPPVAARIKRRSVAALQSGALQNHLVLRPGFYPDDVQALALLETLEASFKRAVDCAAGASGDRWLLLLLSTP